MSVGERLLPYLFAALEACCIDALLIGLASVQVSPSQALAPIEAILHVAFPLFLIAMLAILLIIIIRRLRQRKQSEEDERESLWSWMLFWSQIAAFFRSLLAIFFPALRQRKATDTDVIGEHDGSNMPAVRTIRDVYRRLLRQAAKYGCSRRRDETSYEFEARLRERFPVTEPELSVITEMYTLARYSEISPDEHEVVRMHNVWKELESKWQL